MITPTRASRAVSHTRRARSRNGVRPEAPAPAPAEPASRRGLISVEEAIARIRAGKMIIVVDDADRENEGDVVFAAEKATPEMVNFAVKYGRGILCAPMGPEEADRLGLKLMVAQNTAKFGTPFTESVDARRGTTTGTSVQDRAKTLRTLADPRSSSRDLVRPGHVFPLRAVPGGVLRRAGHSEAVPDLCTLAGLRPVGALCEILSDDGRMMRLPELARLRAPPPARDPDHPGPDRVPPPARDPRPARRHRAAADARRRVPAPALPEHARGRPPRRARQGQRAPRRPGARARRTRSA